MKARRDVHWHTSPACARNLERLACRGNGTPAEIAADVHCASNYAQSLLRLLLCHDLIAVAGWLRHYQGIPTPIYRIGPGPGKPMPKADTNAARSRRRREALIKLYGQDIAYKVLNPKAHGYVRPHVDGKRVRPRDAGPMRAGTVT